MPRALLVSPDGLLGAARPDLAVIAVMARLAHPEVAHVWAVSASRVVALRCTTDELLARADACFSCHGEPSTYSGAAQRDTSTYGTAVL